ELETFRCPRHLSPPNWPGFLRNAAERRIFWAGRAPASLAQLKWILEERAGTLGSCGLQPGLHLSSTEELQTLRRGHKIERPAVIIVFGPWRKDGIMDATALRGRSVTQ